MAVIKTNPMGLTGPWAAGYVLDYHSVSATPTGDPYHPFEMKYTDLGGRLFRFKYRNDESALPDILDTAEDFIRGLKILVDCVVPAPPSVGRVSQPVVELARELAKRLGLPVFEAAVVKIKVTPSMKNIPDWWERQRALEEAIQAGSEDIKGRDGRSRGTLRSIVDLVRQSKPVIVYIAPAKSFCTLRQSDDIAEMLSGVDPSALQGLDSELRSFAKGGGSGQKSESLHLF